MTGPERTRRALRSRALPMAITALGLLVALASLLAGCSFENFEHIRRLDEQVTQTLSGIDGVVVFDVVVVVTGAPRDAMLDLSVGSSDRHRIFEGQHFDVAVATVTDGVLAAMERDVACANCTQRFRVAAAIDPPASTFDIEFSVEAHLEATRSLEETAIEIRIESDPSSPHRRLHDSATYRVPTTAGGPLTLLRIETVFPESITVHRGMGDHWPTLWSARIDTGGTTNAPAPNRIVPFWPRMCNPGPGCVGSEFILVGQTSGITSVSVEQSLLVLDAPFPADSAELSVEIEPPSRWVDMGSVAIPGAKNDVEISFKLSRLPPGVTAVPLLMVDGSIPTGWGIGPSLTSAALLSNQATPYEAQLWLALFGTDELPADFEITMGDPYFFVCDPGGC